jgi:hypothetical protein
MILKKNSLNKDAMKKNTFFLGVIFLLALSFSACKKMGSSDPPNIDPTDINNMVVSPGFDWKTTQDLTLKATQKTTREAQWQM